MYEGYGVLILIAAALLVVLAVLWFFLPFAVFGTKEKLDQIIAEMKVTNGLIGDIRTLLSTANNLSESLTGDQTPIKCEECGKTHAAGAAVCPFCRYRRLQFPGAPP